MPGALPLRINVVKFAESRRTKNFAVKGAPAEPSVQARTAYQLIYPDGTVMIDSGMDLQVHKFFGRGVEEPYFPEATKQVEAALRGAKLNVVDLKLHMAVRWFIGGKVDYIPATIFAGYPKLIRIHDAVRDHPGVKSWDARS